jgi:hypothetical protein
VKYIFVKLYWIKYSLGYRLILYLAKTNNHVIGIDVASMPDKEIAMLRKNLEKLSNLSGSRLMAWVKDNLPISYNRGFRTFKEKECIISKTYDIKPS